MMGEASHPGLQRRLALGADIDAACRVLTDEHGRQAGFPAAAGCELRRGVADRCADLRGGGLTVDDAGAHAPYKRLCSAPSSSRWRIRIRISTTSGEKSMPP